MTRRIPMMLLVVFISASALHAQGNIDWAEYGHAMQPPSPASQPHGWMAGQRQYTGLAYDSLRELLYVVNPATVTVGGRTEPRPTIRILDPFTLLSVTSTGRDAVTGAGGVLPVPFDTVVAESGWPGGNKGGFSGGQFSLFKIDVDDEGRIWACNLVAPLFGICFPGPPPNCDSAYLNQGPLRVYRWDTPTSTPRRMYVTLNAAGNGTGSLGNSQMSWTRWGDAFEVTGKRERVYDSATASYKVVDKTLVYVTGVKDAGMDDEILILGRDTTLQVSDGLGRNLEYRIVRRLSPTERERGGYGLAVQGRGLDADVWTSWPNGNVHRWSGTLSGTPPRSSVLETLSRDPITGTGQAGPLSFFRHPLEPSQAFLLCADGIPTHPTDPTEVNLNTRARVMNVSQSGNGHREPGMGDTPYFGQKILHNTGALRFISDVDYAIRTFGNEYDCLRVFVLFSNNGITAFRQRSSLPADCWLPVELSSFTIQVLDGVAMLVWRTEGEQNNAGFEVQRRFADGTWTSIGFVAGGGTTETARDYRYNDPITPSHTGAGSATYRLRQIDTDGTADYSHEVLQRFDAAGPLRLEQNAPNPFTEETVIRFTLPESSPVRLVLHDALGREIRVLVDEARNAGSYAEILHSDGLAPGLYHCRLTAAGRAVTRGMIVDR